MVVDLNFPSGSRDPQIVRGAVAILATGFLLYKAYVVALACYIFIPSHIHVMYPYLNYSSDRKADIASLNFY